MPIIEMHLMTGRTIEQKRRVVAAVAEATATALGVDKNTVRILITEHGLDEFAVAGVTAGQKAELAAAAAATAAGASEAAAKAKSTT
ncbi:tautomerase family protein [Aquabacterium sp.]|jgi:4-oxalocrotonate tautomerase|uniref:tautomerase family protein n=1 Tax=Aquabacterium sp. TaxID=1872578 RepID=UPI00343FE977